MFHVSLVSLGAQHLQHILHEPMTDMKVRKKEMRSKMPIPRGLLRKMVWRPVIQLFMGGPEARLLK